jgi:hypothetical protein
VWTLLVVHSTNNMKLTAANYFTLKNRYLSNSKVNAYLKDKEYFKKLYITGEIKKEPTAALLIGSAVDSIVTGGWKEFNKKFCQVDRRKEQVPKGKINLTNGQNQEAVGLANKLLSQPAIQIDMPINADFIGVCGVVDFLDINGNVATITDLKTAAKVENTWKWYWHCKEYGYIQQLAWYGMLVKHNHPEVTKINYRHIVAEKDSDDIYRCFTFIFDDALVQIEENKILHEYLPQISAETEYKSPLCTWSNFQLIDGHQLI